MEAFSENNTDLDVLVPLNDKIEMSEEELQNKSFILMGSGHSGKNSTVRWLMRDKERDVIELDCRIWKSDTSFINQLTICLLYTSPSPRDQRGSRMPSSA